MTRIQIEDGKYSFILDDNNLIQHTLRHGEPWQAGHDLFKYNKCVHAMLWEIMELRKEKAERENQNEN